MLCMGCRILYVRLMTNNSLPKVVSNNMTGWIKSELEDAHEQSGGLNFPSLRFKPHKF